MDHPFLLPGLCRDLLQFSSGFESVSYFGSKKHRQGSNRKQEFRMFGWLPMLAVSGQATRTDQEVGMGMIEHGSGPRARPASWVVHPTTADQRRASGCWPPPP